jgi:hypothetical protein
MTKFTEKHLPWILLALITITMVILTLISEGYSGGADNVNHYLLSRFAWQHPLNFFDPWGRPVYTILSFPAAQLGFMSAKLFNVFLGICTAYFSYRIAKRLDIRPSYLVMVFVVFTPMYCVMLPTTLTEIIFSLMLVMAVFFFFRENYIASAIILSFLPFARSEGIIMIPVFILAYLLKRKYKPIPFLLTGFIVLSIAGGYFYKDLFWIINHPAYPIHHPTYKTPGPLLHFYHNLNFIFGGLLKYLFLAGSAWLLFQLYMKKWSVRCDTFFAILLVFVPFTGYFIFHSLLYWKALGGSIGLIRVLAAVLPLAAIVALMGYQWIVELFFKHPWQKVGIMIITCIALITTCFKIYPFPVELSPEEQLIKKATEWVKSEGYVNNKIYFNDFNVPFFMGLDPKDKTRCAQKWYINQMDPTPQWLPDSVIFIWDAHFGPNECGVRLDSLMMNPRYQLLNRFRPPAEQKTFGGFNYEVYIFLSLPRGISADNKAILQLLKKKENGYQKTIYTSRLDFEQARTREDSILFTRKTASSGTGSLRVSSNKEYGPGFTILCSSLPKGKTNFIVNVSVAVFPEVPFIENPTSLVISLESNGTSYYYRKFQLAERDLRLKQWNIVNVGAALPGIKSPDDKLKIYFWHEGKKEFLVDNMIANILMK